MNKIKQFGIVCCAMLVSAISYAADSKEAEFETYKAALKQEAVAQGFGKQFIDNVFSTVGR